ncbi:Uricase (urate oxidase) [Candidatus Burkholderia humilis]|nr:Uricase (urate oxidase) [Candidatus Burkholderia humilis]
MNNERSTPARDFEGYGAHPSHANWPNGARIAINLVMNYEEGSEPAIEHGERHSETWFTESHGLNSGVIGRDLAAEGLFEYGSRVGFWRLMRIIQERDLPATVYACALALERNPAAAAAIRDSGFDVCSHGWRWVQHYLLSPEEERRHIRMAVESLTRTMGRAPEGWYWRYLPSVNTRHLLVEHGGFLYDSDYYGDELPFWTKVGDTPHLVIPYSLTTNDGQYASATGTSQQWFEFVKDSFDTLYKEGATTPKMFIYASSGIRRGPPVSNGSWTMSRITRGVWFTRRIDIARHWIKAHSYPGT